MINAYYNLKTSPPSIVACGVSLIFQEQILCENLSFTIPEGVISLVAPQNELLKAAILEMLAGRLRPAVGHCRVGSDDICDLPFTIRHKIAVFENIEHSYEVMTVGQTAIFFGGCYPQWDNERYTELIEEFRLTKRMKICNLGNHQRTLIALAILLSRNPHLLVLDDWLSGLDPTTWSLIYSVVHRVRHTSGQTTIFLGHHRGLRQQLIDNLILLGYSTALTLPTADVFDRNQPLISAKSSQDDTSNPR